MTIGFWVTFCIIALLGIAITIIGFNYEATYGIISLLISVVICGSMVLVGNWYYGSTANGIRAVKDERSNLHNGLNREITITAEDGREIYHYKGKCDIETNDGYILFEDEDGYRQMIYWGELDTIVISELD